MHNHIPFGGRKSGGGEWRVVRRWLGRSAATLVLLAFLGYGLLALVLYLKQDRFVFHPGTESPAFQRAVSVLPGVEEWRVAAEPGVVLRGWLRRAPGGGRHGALLYFAGNTGDVAGQVEPFSRLRERTVVLMNYRGFGASGGRPSEAALCRDALALYDALVRRPDVDARRVDVVGYSLGSGVATFLAARRPIRRVVLLAPYASILALARDQFPWMPVKLLLRHPFDSVSRAPAIRSPLLCLIAAADEVIPRAHSLALFRAWGGKKEYRVIPASTHGTIWDRPEIWPAMGHFLEAGEETGSTASSLAPL